MVEILTAEQIVAAKFGMLYSPGCRQDVAHSHDDCVRVAYVWLDAQLKAGTCRKVARPWKHIIENWGGRYVSRADVELAADIHPDIIGQYPYFNIGTRLVAPYNARLDRIETARTDGVNRFRSDLKDGVYWWRELYDGQIERIKLHD